MAEVTSDPARYLKWYFRINKDNTKTLSFYDSNGDALSLTDYTFALNFKKRQGDTANFLQLTSGSGLTKSGNELAVAVTKTQAALFRDQIYFAELVVTKNSLERVYLSIDAVWHNGTFDGIETDDNSLTVYEEGTPIEITVTDISTNTNTTTTNLSGLFLTMGA